MAGQPCEQPLIERFVTIRIAQRAVFAPERGKPTGWDRYRHRALCKTADVDHAIRQLHHFLERRPDGRAQGYSHRTTEADRPLELIRLTQGQRFFDSAGATRIFYACQKIFANYPG